MAGKIQVLESLVASKPVHAVSVVTIWDNFVQEMKSSHKEFIWRNRKSKVKHTALIGDYVEGGSIDIDIGSKLIPIKILWVRRLALAGKIQVLESLVASKPVHAVSVVTISDNFVQEMKSLHKEFIWSNRKPKIKHTASIGDHAEGGSIDIDMESKLIPIKILWVRRLKNSDFHPWEELASQFLSSLGGDSVFYSDLSLVLSLKMHAKVFLLFIVKWSSYGRNLLCV